MKENEKVLRTAQRPTPQAGAPGCRATEGRSIDMKYQSSKKECTGGQATASFDKPTAVCPSKFRSHATISHCFEYGAFK